MPTSAGKPDQPLQIETIPLGPLQTNAYLLTGGGGCWIVDAPPQPQELIDVLRQRRLTPSRILLTHGHGDHIGGASQIAETFPGVRLCCPAGDANMLTDAAANLSQAFGMPITSPPADELLAPGQTLAMGELTFRVLDTSGHTAGGVSFHCPQAGAVFTGDALFDRSIGRTDLPGGSLGRLIKNIRLHLLSLDDATVVLPGHGPATTIEQERKDNPYLILAR